MYAEMPRCRDAEMPLEIMRGFEQTSGCMILEAYGLSETSPVASFNHPGRVRKPGSIGTPMQGVEMRVVDGEGASSPVGEVGEIAIRGHNVMKCYWGKPEATAEAIPDGWFRVPGQHLAENRAHPVRKVPGPVVSL